MEIKEPARTDCERFYNLFHYILSADMPRPGGIHIYSTGNMFKNLVTTCQNGEWKIELSRGVPYSSYAMGFDDNMNPLKPRGRLERINFKTLKKTSIRTARVLAQGGKVICKI